MTPETISHVARAEDATQIVLPDVLRPDGPLETRIRSFDCARAELPQRRLMDAFLAVLIEWRKLWLRKMTAPSMTAEQAMYETLFQYKWPDNMDLFAYSVLEASYPARTPDITYPVARQYEENRVHFDAILGDTVSPRLSFAATYVARSDNYDADPLNGIPDFAKVDDCAVYAEKRLQKLRSSQTTCGTTTGIAPLDEATGGIHGLCVMAGPTGGGKSALAFSIGLSALTASPDTALIIHQCDMSKENCFDRMVCALGGVTERELYDRNLPAERKKVVDDAIAQLQAISARIDIVRHPPGVQPGVYQIIERRNKFLAARRCKRAVVIVDYFQLLSVPEKIKDPVEADKRRVEIVQTLQQSQNHAGSGADDMLVISEVRKTDGDGALGISDLLGSARIGYAADTVLMLQPPNVDTPCDADSVPVTLSVVKARGGRKARIRLMFDFLTYRFRAADISQPAPAAPKRRKSAARNPLG